MLYTLQLLLSVFLLIKLVRNLYLLLIFRKFFSNTYASSLYWVSLTGLRLGSVLLLCHSTNWPVPGLRRLRLGFKAISSSAEKNLSLSSFGQVLLGIGHQDVPIFATGPPCLDVLEWGIVNRGRGHSRNVTESELTLYPGFHAKKLLTLFIRTSVLLSNMWVIMSPLLLLSLSFVPFVHNFMCVYWSFHVLISQFQFF